MKSSEYRAIIATIVRNSLAKYYPGLKVKRGVVADQDEICHYIARAIHARMYGANVDGVESPIWGDLVNGAKPNVSASELMERKIDDEK